MQLVHNYLKKLLSKYKILNKTFPLKKIGYFDGLHESGFLYGWAINPLESGKNQKLHFFINKVLVGTAWTWQDRPDVSEKMAVDGRAAGFYCALQSAEYFQLLQPGYTLTISFDEAASESLRGQLVFDDANIPKLLQGSLRALASSKSDRPYQQIEKILSDTASSNAIHWSDKACIFLDHFLSEFQSSKNKDFLSQLKHTAGQWALPNNLLELELISVLWQIENNALDRIDLKKLEAAFLERHHEADPKINHEALKSRCFNLLETIMRRLFLMATRSKSMALKRKAEIAFTFGKWAYKLGGHYQLALNFLDLVPQEEIANLSNPMALELLGRMQRAANRNVLASNSFKAAIHSNNCTWYSDHEMGVLIRAFSQEDGNISDDTLSNAFAQFIRASELNFSQRLSHREALSFANSYFDKLIEKTKSMAQIGLKREANSERSGKLHVIRTLTEELFSKDQVESSAINAESWISKNNPKVMLLGSKSLHQCFYYRIFQKMELLKALGLECEFIDTYDLSNLNWRESLIGVGLLYLCRTVYTNAERVLISYAKALRIPIIYDIDDLIFDDEYFPPSLSTYANTIDISQHLHLQLDCPLFAETLASADFVSVSTNTLAKHVRKFISPSIPVIVLPNLLGNSLQALASEQKASNDKHGGVIKAKPKKSRIKIFYGSGTKAHKQIFYEKFLPAALVTLKEFAHVDLHLMGYFEKLPEHLLKTGRIVLREPTSDFYGYLKILQEMDINIAVLEESLVTDAKSEIKWLEAAAFAIPSIVSPTATYREVLEDGKTAIFAKTSADWSASMGFLISDALSRESIGKSAQNLALEKFGTTTGAEILGSLLKTAGVLPLQKGKKRLLFCNVYFAPQSTGGATRVVETQVRGMLDNYADEYEVYVLTTTDFTSSSPGSMEVEQYWYRNCLVTRLSMPQNDWLKPEDQNVLNFCKRFFSEYQFDLIHMHSMQVLTGSVGLAAKELQIPYIITLHDAWWLSKYMFLIDEFGNAVDPGNPLSGGSSKNSEEIKALLRRDKILRGVLSDAKTLLAVSQKFADLYTKAGIKNVEVHENIVEPFEIFERAPEPDGKIVLGFIGGMSKHKGYHLFRQALEEGDFPNYKALIVDSGLGDGESYETMWGSTTVKFIPKVKQAEIGKLYAQMDVLVAPSIWPESFGLVTREAMMAGVWVITSDEGAIGDCINNDINGIVIKPSEDEIINSLISIQSKSLFIKELELENNNGEYVDILSKFYSDTLNIKL